MPLNQVSPSCPVCSTPKSLYLKTVNETGLFLCGLCALRFSWPMQHPGSQWYEESAIYEEVAWNVPSVASLGRRWEFKQPLGATPTAGQEWFDVGCGRGDFLKLAESKGGLVFGIDLNPDLVQLGRNRYGLSGIEQASF